MFRPIQEILASDTFQKYILGEIESPIEARLYSYLKDCGFNPKIQVKIGNYRVDMLIDEPFFEKKVIIECDGKEFHTNEKKEKIRDSFLQSRGYLIVHFTGWEINYTVDGCFLRLVAGYLPEIMNEDMRWLDIHKRWRGLFENSASDD